MEQRAAYGKEALDFYEKHKVVSKGEEVLTPEEIHKNMVEVLSVTFNGVKIFNETTKIPDLTNEELDHLSPELKREIEVIGNLSMMSINPSKNYYNCPEVCDRYGLSTVTEHLEVSDKLGHIFNTFRIVNSEGPYNDKYISFHDILRRNLETVKSLSNQTIKDSAGIIAKSNISPLSHGTALGIIQREISNFDNEFQKGQNVPLMQKESVLMQIKDENGNKKLKYEKEVLDLIEAVKEKELVGLPSQDIVEMAANEQMADAYKKSGLPYIKLKNKQLDFVGNYNKEFVEGLLDSKTIPATSKINTLLHNYGNIKNHFITAPGKEGAVRSLLEADQIISDMKDKTLDENSLDLDDQYFEELRNRVEKSDLYKKMILADAKDRMSIYTEDRGFSYTPENATSKIVRKTRRPALNTALGPSYQKDFKDELRLVSDSIKTGLDPLGGKFSNPNPMELTKWLVNGGPVYSVNDDYTGFYKVDIGQDNAKTYKTSNGNEYVFGAPQISTELVTEIEIPEDAPIEAYDRMLPANQYVLAKQALAKLDETEGFLVGQSDYYKNMKNSLIHLRDLSKELMDQNDPNKSLLKDENACKDLREAMKHAKDSAAEYMAYKYPKRESSKNARGRYGTAEKMMESLAIRADQMDRYMKKRADVLEERHIEAEEERKIREENRRIEKEKSELTKQLKYHLQLSKIDEKIMGIQMSAEEKLELHSALVGLQQIVKENMSNEKFKDGIDHIKSGEDLKKFMDENGYSKDDKSLQRKEEPIEKQQNLEKEVSQVIPS